MFQYQFTMMFTRRLRRILTLDVYISQVAQLKAENAALRASSADSALSDSTAQLHLAPNSDSTRMQEV